jgi:geranylgeranyl transferase type-2 subunit beta
LLWRFGTIKQSKSHPTIELLQYTSLLSLLVNHHTTRSVVMSTIRTTNEDDEYANEEIVIDLGIGNSTVPFYRERHLAYIATLSNKLDRPSSYEGAVTEHLRMSGIYWTYAALSLLVSPSEADKVLGVTTSIDDSRPAIVEWVLRCYDAKSGGFGGNIGHDGHLLYTLSALQILVMAEHDMKNLPVEDIVNFVASLQRADGSFAGDEWGEIDTRFSYCALSALSLLSAMDQINLPKAVQYIASCQNLDGGFGSMMGAESHAGQVFCCVGALSIAKSLHVIRHPDLLGWWLAERQVDSGGLNGRPEKQADVCYSWWILSVLSIIGRVDWISCDKLAAFIAKAQDPDDGGIADRPEDMPDIFHTFFGIAGLSILGKLPDSLRQIDPVYALPVDVVKRCGLSAQIIASNAGVADSRFIHYDVIERAK